jgi:hypothetical protein
MIFEFAFVAQPRKRVAKLGLVFGHSTVYKHMYTIAAGCAGYGLSDAVQGRWKGHASARPPQPFFDNLIRDIHKRVGC